VGFGSAVVNEKKGYINAGDGSVSSLRFVCDENECIHEMLDD